MTALMAVLAAVFLGGLGLLVGSFLNVVIHRVPEGASVVRPRSSCPGCGSMISARDNIPVVSWLILRGRCRSCGEPIRARYPLVELATMLLWLLLGWWALAGPGDPGLLPVLLVVGSAGVALTVIDLDHHRLPNVIVLPLYPAALVGLIIAGVSSGSWPWIPALVGAVLWLVVVGLPWLVSGGRGMGFGDVKLAPVLGAVLGWAAVSAAVTGLLAAFLFGALVGLAAMIFAGAGRKTALPFGPFLLAGALIGLLAGPPLASWYAGVLG